MKPSRRKPYYYITINNDLNSDYIDIPASDNNIYQDPRHIEIHIGNSNVGVERIEFSYLRTPKQYTLSEISEISESFVINLEDNSETDVLEFPDYVCYEIINTCVRLILENSSDPRLQTNVPVNQTIAAGNTI